MKAWLGLTTVLFALLAICNPVAAGAEEPKDQHSTLRDGSAHNLNFDLDGIDDYRVDADIAILQKGNPPEGNPGVNMVHRVDCANPDPTGEKEGLYVAPDPEDPDWVPDPLLNETNESPYGPYGCLENSGSPPVGGSINAHRGTDIDGYKESRGGIAAGVRIWTVKVLSRLTINFGEYPDPENVPLTLGGSALGPVSSPAVSAACGESSFEAQLYVESVELTLDAEYDECLSAGTPATVDMNSCHYVLATNNSGPPYTGTVGVACDEAGDGIEIHAYEGEKLACTQKVGAQTGIGGIALATVGEGAARGVAVDSEASGFTYQLSGPACKGGTGTFANGSLAGETTLVAANEGEEQRGFFLFGKKSDFKVLGPRFMGGTGYLPGLGTLRVVAGLNWVAAHADQIDVAYFQIGCPLEEIELEEAEGTQVDGTYCDAHETMLKAAVDRVIDKGIVVVAAVSLKNEDSGVFAPQNDPDVVSVSAVVDADGLAGGSATKGCAPTLDDRRLNVPGGTISDYGPLVDMAASLCGDTGGASSKVAGAAAALASQCKPTDRAGVEWIVDTLMAEGDTGEIPEGGWLDDSGDGWKEPLLNLRDEEVFNPFLIRSPSNPEGKEDVPMAEACKWRSHQAESDVGSDGRADLVAIDGQAKGAEVSRGKDSGYETAAPSTSLSGQLDSALLDGKGRYAIDTADVTGDRHADLVTAGSGEGVYVHPGNGEGGFGTAVESLKGTTLRFGGSGGTLEPIAVADVDGDGRADLVAHSATESRILTYPGQANGSFGTAIDSGLSVDSALLDRSGHYFLDAIDVTGEELDAMEPIDYFARHSYADLVTTNTDGSVYVFEGQASGKFAAPVAAASLNPIMDDGKGAEPIGLGDVDRDRRADLLALEGEALKLFEADLNLETGAFSFKEAPKPYAGSIDSSLLDGTGEELIGLLDHSRDGLADLVSVKADGTVLTYIAQRDRTFAAPKAQGGSLPSVRTSASGHEFVAEKPILRRAGCVASGCDWPSETFANYADPVAAYSFNEGSGTTLKDSAGNHDGTIEGATWTTAGKYGSALDFDGTNDLVSIADANDLDFTSAFTLEAWVRPDSVAVTRPVISKTQGASGTFSGYLLHANAGGKPRGLVLASGTGKGVEGPNALATAAWSHLAFTSDGTTLRLYVDGQLASTAPAMSATANTNALKLGRDGITSSWFDGLIDEVRIYGVPLSESQIQVDRDSPVDPTPVAAYSFNENEGTTLIDSAGNHDGTIEGASWSASGKYGSALDFDGTNDLVSIADAADLDLTGSFTMEAWMRPDVLGGTLFSKTESPTGSAGYMLNMQSSGKPRGYVANSGTLKSAESETAVSSGAWSHVAFTSDGTTLRVYVEGKLTASATGIAAKASAAKLEIGHNQLFNLFFDGLIDEVRIYEVPLSESQIQVDRESPVDPTPVAAYSFNENEGTTLIDSAGNHDGTIEGATWTTAGRYGSALNFDGSNDLVSIADAADLDLTGSFTMEAWMRPDASVGSLFSKTESPTGSAGYMLNMQSSGKPRGYVANSGTLKSAESSTAIANGNWAHVAFTSDGITLRVYVEGKLTASATGIAAKASAAKLEIGHNQLFNTWFDGLIDEVRLYGVPLSEAQIKVDRSTAL